MCPCRQTSPSWEMGAGVVVSLLPSRTSCFGTGHQEKRHEDFVARDAALGKLLGQLFQYFAAGDGHGRDRSRQCGDGWACLRCEKFLSRDSSTHPRPRSLHPLHQCLFAEDSIKVCRVWRSGQIEFGRCWPSFFEQSQQDGIHVARTFFDLRQIQLGIHRAYRTTLDWNGSQEKLDGRITPGNVGNGFYQCNRVKFAAQVPYCQFDVAFRLRNAPSMHFGRRFTAVYVKNAFRIELR
jgi:hypothetical protein